MSTEALAMAGVSYTECRIDFRVMEYSWLESPPPPCLLAEKYVSSENDKGADEGKDSNMG